MKLKYQLRYDDARVYLKYTEIDPKLRDVGLYFEFNGVTFKSAQFPEIGHSTVFLYGINKTKDLIEVSFRTMSPKELYEKIDKAFKLLLKEIYGKWEISYVQSGRLD